MFYDLHIHSCLSPCGNAEMTLNNIVNMAKLKQLSLIALTDHNTTLNLAAFGQVAQKANLQFVYGIELQTQEEVHVLAYFKDLAKVKALQSWIDKNLIRVKNEANYFGKQAIVNCYDEIVAYYPDLLLMSVGVEISEVIRVIHQYQGRVVLAHIFKESNGIISQLGFIPSDLDFDGLEVKSKKEINQILVSHPWLQGTIFFINSDAHQLIDISEAEHEISLQTWDKFWRKQK